MKPNGSDVKETLFKRIGTFFKSPAGAIATFGALYTCYNMFREYNGRVYEQQTRMINLQDELQKSQKQFIDQNSKDPKTSKLAEDRIKAIRANLIEVEGCLERNIFQRWGLFSVGTGSTRLINYSRDLRRSIEEGKLTKEEYDKFKGPQERINDINSQKKP